MNLSENYVSHNNKFLLMQCPALQTSNAKGMKFIGLKQIVSNIVLLVKFTKPLFMVTSKKKRLCFNN